MFLIWECYIEWSNFFHNYDIFDTFLKFKKDFKNIFSRFADKHLPLLKVKAFNSKKLALPKNNINKNFVKIGLNKSVNCPSFYICWLFLKSL